MDRQAVLALKAHIEKEITRTRESLEFWQAQPPSGIIAQPGLVDLSVNRVANLEAEIAEEVKILKLLDEWLAKESKTREWP